MANDLDDLTNARKVLTEVRLNWAKDLAAGYKRGETETTLKSLIEIQQAIEVIDTAMNELEEAELERKPATNENPASAAGLNLSMLTSRADFPHFPRHGSRQYRT